MSSPESGPARGPVTVKFLPREVTVSARAGDTVLDAALDGGVWIEHECGGNCSCTTCHIHVTQGAELLSPIEEPEDYRLTFAVGRSPDSRLACQALILGGPVEILTDR